MNPLLRVTGLEAGYGASQVLFGIDFEVDKGEFVTLLGRNGMGKTTTIKSVCGAIKPTRGEVWWREHAVQGQPGYRITGRGIGLVPEGRQVFPNLSVRENLVATAHNRRQQSDPWTLDRVYQFFPRLKDRAGNLGGNLSGGEQQMLAIGRALMTNPELMILDEATEGLAPRIRQEIWSRLAQLKETGLAIICIDKNLGPLLRLADRHYILEKGKVAWSGTSRELREERPRLEHFLGI